MSGARALAAPALALLGCLGEERVTCGAGGLLSWSESGVLRFARLDGTGGVTLVPREVVGTAIEPATQTLYWLDRDVMRARFDGSEAEILYPAGRDRYNLAVDAQEERVFWTEPKEVLAGYLDGSSRGRVIGAQSAYGLALDPMTRTIYWTNLGRPGAIYRAGYDGSRVELFRSAEGGTIWSVAVDSERGLLFWTEDGRVQAARLDGSEVRTIAEERPYASSLALDRMTRKVYWAAGATIRRVGYDGSHPELLHVAPFFASVGGLSVCPE